ncbi:O-methyltransferase family protein [Raphanus sativus]|nr:O-methyltransferase family protein [Raphanus sativus]
MALPMVLKAALELGVIETITAVDEGVWLSSYEIALRLPTKPTNPEAPVLLDRMLILIANHSILKHRLVDTGENGETKMVYAVGPICTFFFNRGDGWGSLAPLFMINLSEVYFKTWMHLKDVILEGKDAFTCAHGKTSRFTMNKVLEVYRGFEDVNTLVDVGGGNGTAISLVVSKYPHIKGINLDLACVIADAPLYPGVEHVSGDMFTEIPKGDAMFLKWILHCWNDEDCVKN